MMRANQGLRDVFGAGTTLSQGGAALTSAGGMLQTDAQGQLDASAIYSSDNATSHSINMASSAICSAAPMSARFRPSTANPYTAALSGAMMGAGLRRQHHGLLQ